MNAQIAITSGQSLLAGHDQLIAPSAKAQIFTEPKKIRVTPAEQEGIVEEVTEKAEL
ncbi:MAG: hypothetical protein QXR63_07275 [Candidatus Bathyarchaeia archaeon]